MYLPENISENSSQGLDPSNNGGASGYNSYIDAHNENSLKKFVYETDDIQYPFYLIQPKRHQGKCLNFEVGELGEFKVRIKPCSNTKTERFEAMIYETHDGCNDNANPIA